MAFKKNRYQSVDLISGVIGPLKVISRMLFALYLGVTAISS